MAILCLSFGIPRLISLSSRPARRKEPSIASGLFVAAEMVGITLGRVSEAMGQAPPDSLIPERLPVQVTAPRLESPESHARMPRNENVFTADRVIAPY